MSNYNNLLGLPQGSLGSPINCAVSSSSGAVALNTGGYGDVNNMSCTIYATGDYPVVIRFIPDGTSNESVINASVTTGTAPQAVFKLLRNGTNVGQCNVKTSEYNTNSNKDNNFPPGILFFMDFPSKGTWTYKLQGYANSTAGTPSGSVSYVKMVVYEDRNLIYK